MHADPPPAGPVFYIPGLKWLKSLVFCFGLSFTGAALFLVRAPLSLMVTGTSTTGELTSVVFVQPGEPERRIALEADLLIQEKATEWTMDGAYFAEFTFRDTAGAVHTVRWKHGSRFRSQDRLEDQDGIATQVSVLYHPDRPQGAYLPFDLRVWFNSMMLFIVSVLTTVIGWYLWRHADTPIEMPT